MQVPAQPAPLLLEGGDGGSRRAAGRPPAGAPAGSGPAAGRPGGARARPPRTAAGRPARSADDQLAPGRRPRAPAAGVGCGAPRRRTGDQRAVDRQRRRTAAPAPRGSPGGRGPGRRRCCSTTVVAAPSGSGREPKSSSSTTPRSITCRGWNVVAASRPTTASTPTDGAAPPSDLERRATLTNSGDVHRPRQREDDGVHDQAADVDDLRPRDADVHAPGRRRRRRTTAATPRPVVWVAKTRTTPAIRPGTPTPSDIQISARRSSAEPRSIRHQMWAISTSATTSRQVRRRRAPDHRDSGDDARGCDHDDRQEVDRVPPAACG